MKSWGIVSYIFLHIYTSIFLMKTNIAGWKIYRMLMISSSEVYKLPQILNAMIFAKSWGGIIIIDALVPEDFRVWIWITWFMIRYYMGISFALCESGQDSEDAGPGMIEFIVPSKFGAVHITIPLIQEISNRTHWTDPSTWESNSPSNFLRGPLVRSHSVFDGPFLLFFCHTPKEFWVPSDESVRFEGKSTNLCCVAKSAAIGDEIWSRLLDYIAFWHEAFARI